MKNLEQDFKLFASDKKVSTSLYDDYAKKLTNSYIEPTIVEERSLNVTQISAFSRLFMDRILFLGSGIDSDVANIMNAQLLYLEMVDPEKPITVYINSPGGSVYDGMSIYDVFQYVSCPIQTTCIGTAASMGAVLLSSGEKGCRSALPHSSIMIHQPSGGTGRVSASDMEIAWEEMKKCKEMLYEVLSNNTGKTVEEIEALCDRDKWYTSAEALENGLIDNIIKRK